MQAVSLFVTIAYGKLLHIDDLKRYSLSRWLLKKITHFQYFVIMNIIYFTSVFCVSLLYEIFLFVIILIIHVQFELINLTPLMHECL